jgi:hypothetical protein
VAVAIAAVVVSGSVVTDAAGVRPSLETKGFLEGVEPDAPEPTRPEPAVQQLTPESLLTADQVSTTLGGAWSQGQTSGNTQGDGLALRCQAGRYADPEGVAALLRTFKQGETGLGQYVEVSADEQAGKDAYRTTARWYAGCTAPRVQLLSTQQVRNVGDDAVLFVLRGWNDPTSVQVVGVARTGSVTSTTSLTRPGSRTPPLEASAALLAAAVDDLCGLPSGGACADTPQVRAVAPMAAGPEPSMLGEVDLPPVTKVTLPWVGTDVGPAEANLAATRCENADFAPFDHDMTRTFLIPGADLPAECGLTQTVGALPRRQAVGFVERVRARLASCPDRDLGTEVFRVADESTGDRELVVWRLSVEVSENRTVTFLTGIIRHGTSVAQLTFVPADGVVMGGEPFVALAKRAQDRLARLGRPQA